jgi:two-component system, cell cycle sensor histidine kinase and response regulator CckA
MATILTVDDEPMILTLIATVLEDAGHVVISAESAAEAIDQFRKRNGEVDLLITDISMPGKDGLSLAAELQAKNPDLEVLLMSGWFDRSNLPKRFEFLPKPFLLADMAGKVQELLQRHEEPAAALMAGAATPADARSASF